MSLVVWGVEFKIERLCVSASIETRWCDAGLGIGWWVRGHWR